MGFQLPFPQLVNPDFWTINSISSQQVPWLSSTRVVQRCIRQHSHSLPSPVESRLEIWIDAIATWRRKTCEYLLFYKNNFRSIKTKDQSLFLQKHLNEVSTKSVRTFFSAKITALTDRECFQLPQGAHRNAGCSSALALVRWLPLFGNSQEGFKTMILYWYLWKHGDIEAPKHCFQKRPRTTRG